jgi:hypothetical protein
VGFFHQIPTKNQKGKGKKKEKKEKKNWKKH